MNLVQNKFSSAAFLVFLLSGVIAPELCSGQDAEKPSGGKVEGRTQNGTEPKSDSKGGNSDKKARVSFTAAERDAAMKFAETHHPELSRLLEPLQKSRPSEFARAVREITQQIQQLERVRDKNPARYEAQLESWKQESQIRILLARWTRTKDAELEKQVRALLKQRRESKLAQLKADRDRLTEQQRKLDEQIAEYGEAMESQVDKEWDQLSRKAVSGKEGSGKKVESPSASAGVKK